MNGYISLFSKFQPLFFYLLGHFFIFTPEIGTKRNVQEHCLTTETADVPSFLTFRLFSWLKIVRLPNDYSRHEDDIDVVSAVVIAGFIQANETGGLKRWCLYAAAPGR